jgi:hypothetical protein
MSNSNRAALGINLLWLALILDAVGVVLTYLRISTIPFLQVVEVLIEWFIVYRVASGEAWARIVYLVLTILEVLGTVLVSVIPMPQIVFFQRSGIAGLLTIATPIVRVVGIGLVFMATSASASRSRV